MITKMISSTKGKYFDFCCALVTFNILDMISTDAILNHGRGNVEEVNSVASSLQQDHSIAVFRVITMALLYSALISCKLSNYSLTVAKQQPAWKIAIGKRIFSSKIDTIKLGVLQLCIFVSLIRLIAATSNVMGEFLGSSIPMVSEKIFDLRSADQINIAAILISALISVLVMSSSWEIYRRRSVSA